MFVPPGKTSLLDRPVAGEDIEAVATAKAKAKAKPDVHRNQSILLQLRAKDQDMISEFNKGEIVILLKVLTEDMGIEDCVMMITGGGTDLRSDPGHSCLLHERFAEHGYAHPLRADFFGSMILSLFQEQGIAIDVAEFHAAH